MRDQKRIAKLLQLIGLEWNKNPDMRFGQLLINLGITQDNLYTWNLEDDLVITHMEKLK